MDAHSFHNKKMTQGSAQIPRLPRIKEGVWYIKYQGKYSPKASHLSEISDFTNVYGSGEIIHF